MSLWRLVLIGWAAMAAVMVLLWIVQRARRNAGIVDIAWSFGTGLLAVGFAWGADGAGGRRLLVAVLAGVWGLRLGFYLLKRVLSEAEDGRYRMLRERWGDRTQFYLFWFFQIQALWAVMFAAPMLIAARNPAPLGWADAAGALLWLVAIVGEALADAQLARFRRNPARAGQVCRQGLWRYSRHPNYFFEWLHWWSYVLIGFAGPWGWLTLLGPALMLLFLTRITGIPPTEQRALESRGDAYREYQRTTSVLFPWPPKASTTA
jgi:steroid 5-alpha reductase family enzyme